MKMKQAKHNFSVYTRFSFFLSVYTVPVFFSVYLHIEFYYVNSEYGIIKGL